MSAAAPNPETLSLDGEWYNVEHPAGFPDTDLTNNSPESSGEKSGEITASWHFSDTIDTTFTLEDQSHLYVFFKANTTNGAIKGTFKLTFERLSPNKPAFKQDYTAQLSMTRDAAGEIHYEVLPGLSAAENTTMLACLPCIRAVNDSKIHCYLDNVYPMLSAIIEAIKSIIPADQSRPLSSEQLSQLPAVIVTSLSSFAHLEYAQEVLRYLQGIQTNQAALADPQWINDVFEIILFKGLGIGQENDSDLDSAPDSDDSSDASSDAGSVAGNELDAHRILSILLEHADSCAASAPLIQPPQHTSTASDPLIPLQIGYNPLFDESRLSAADRANLRRQRVAHAASSLDAVTNTIDNLKNVCCLS